MDDYLLDTNAVSALLKGNKPNVTQRSDGIALQKQFIPSIVRAELWFGWQNSPHHVSRLNDLRRFLAGFPTLPFDDAAAEEYGKLRAYLSRVGLPIGPNDLMIASIALANDLVLVTHNTGEFSRVPGLRIEDWQ
ncbi:type II toxin-antitoxin system VapC family toxin [soil metagenome]